MVTTREGNKVMKRIKIFLAVLCVFTVSVAFAGCGNSFDPVAAVEAEMELLTTGTVPEDADDLYSEDLKTVQSEYDKEFQAEVDALVKELDCAAYAEGDRRAKVEKFCRELFAKCKYEVSQDYTEKDDTYLVDVTIEPVDFAPIISKVSENGEFVQKWKDKISSGEYTVTSEEQLMTDLYDDLFDYLSAEIDKAGYAKAETITLKLKDNGKGVYNISQDQTDKLAEMLFSF